MASPDANAEPPVYVLYIFGACLLAGFVRTLSRWTVVHHTVIMFALGALFGYLARIYGSVSYYLNVEFLSGAKLLQVHTLLLPLIIMECLFSMDPRVFLSCSPVAVITVALDYVLTMLVQGLFIFFFLDFYALPLTPAKTTLLLLLMGSLTSVTDTSYVINTFYKMGSYWVLVKLLEIKRVISLVGACVVYIFIVYAREFNYDIGWYNVMVFLLLQFLASPVLGWLVAQLMIFWIGRLYNDIGVEITVSIAAAYVLYYFGTVNIAAKPMVSAIAVVVYALLLNNRRSCFSLGLDTFLYKLCRILAYIIKTVIFTIVGFLITHEDLPKHGPGHNLILFISHILVSFTLYSWCMLSRGLVCVMVAPILRRCGYRLSWQELSTMVFCNVTGTVCLITAVASFNQSLVGLFFDDRRIQYLVMFHLSVLAIIRSLVAGTLFPHVLFVLGMRHVSLGRYVAMSNALQRIQEEIKSCSRTYKFDRFLADADWETVYQFTNFDNPYDDISRYSVIGHAMNLDSDQLGDMRLNLLHASRMSFWRQYEQGLLSLRALRILLEECYLAEWKVTTDHWDIGDQIRKYYEAKGKRVFNAIYKLKQKFENMQETRRLLIAEIVQSAKGKWKLFLFKVGLHVILEIVFIIAAVVISVMSLIVLLAYEQKCSSGLDSTLVRLFYYEFNLAFMVLVTIYIALKLFIFRRRYLLLFGSFFNLSLVIVGWSDVVFHAVAGMLHPADICAELRRTQWAITTHFVFHKIFLAYRCLRLLVLLQDKTFIIVHTMKKRMLLQLQLGYDVGKAFVYCKEDIYQTSRDFITHGPTLEEVRKKVQTTRIQLMRELATVQKQHPGIVVSVKSQEACRRILHVVKETINQLQRNGQVDAYEAGMLDEMIKLRLKRLNKIPADIEMPSVEVLVSKLPWVNGDETLIGFLHFNSRLFNMAEGESVDFDMDPTAGIYVLVSGLIRVNWWIGEPYGQLLQATHVGSAESIHDSGKRQLNDFMSTGSTFGELALMTETPVAIDAVCETSVLMYHIDYDSIRVALDWVKEPSLEWRLWILASIRLSLPLLKALPSYYTYSLEDLKVVADLGTLIVRHLETETGASNEETFNLARYVSSHVILIHGTAKKSGETFVGPIIIPPDNDDLVFSAVYCDSYVLYLIPHRAALTSVGFGLSKSAEEMSTTAMETSKTSKDTSPGPGLAGARTTATRKRGGRKMSVAVAANIKVLDRPLMSTNLRFVGEEPNEKELLTASDRNEQGLQDESKQEQEDQSTSSPATSPPKPHETTMTPIQTVEPVEKHEPRKEEDPIEEKVSEVPVSRPEQVVMNLQNAPEEPQETEGEKATAAKDEFKPRSQAPVGPADVVPRRSSSEVLGTATEDEFEPTLQPVGPTDMVPRRSSSEEVLGTPYTEAWKRLVAKIQVKLSVGSSTPSPVPATPAAARTGTGNESAPPAVSGRQVAADTSTTTTKPASDVDKKNKNVSNSANNNSNNNNNNNSNNNNNNNNNALVSHPHQSEPRASMHATRSGGTSVVSVPYEYHYAPDLQVSHLSTFRRGMETAPAAARCLVERDERSARMLACGPVDEASSDYTTTSVDDKELSLRSAAGNDKPFDNDTRDWRPSPFNVLAADEVTRDTAKSWNYFELQRRPSSAPGSLQLYTQCLCS